MKFILHSFLAFFSLNWFVLISPTIAQTTEKEELVGDFSVVVEDIRVEGLQRIEPGTVFSLIDIELKEIVDFLNDVESKGGEIFSVDSTIDAGLRVSGLGGIISLLRFPLEF